MKDKEIIIDGIDVSKCEFLIINNDKQLCRCIKSDLFGGIEFVENAKNGNCKDNPNCYYKQLKRKEQECEELKEEIDDLKEIIQRHDNDNNALLSEFEDDLVDYYRRYKECLTEIKKIAESEIDSKEFMVVQCMLNGSVDNKNKILEQILQKISEVED